VGVTEKPPAALLAGIERVFGFKPPPCMAMIRDKSRDAAIIDGRSKAYCLAAILP